MKHFRHILLLPTLLILLTTACQQDETNVTIPDTFSVTLDIDGAQLSKAPVTADPAECIISNVYLLFYEQGASGVTTPGGFHKETVTGTATSWSKSFKTTDFPNLKPYTTYDVYALVSLPGSNTTEPDEYMYKSALLALTEQQFKRSKDKRGISFTGQTSYTTGTLGPLAPINLTRTVARLDITLKSIPSGITINDIAVEQSADGYYLPGQPAPAPSARKSFNAFLGDDGVTYHCYVYENVESAAPYSLIVEGYNTASGQPLFYMGELKPDGKSTIQRNHIYNIETTVKTRSIIMSGGRLF